MNEETLVQSRTVLFFLIPMLIGAAVGVLFLFPINELVFFYEHRPEPGSAGKFATEQLWRAILGGTPIKTLFYAGIGAFLGLLSALFYNVLYKSTARIKKLSDELGKGLLPLIAHGESATLEFKSTFRWDTKEGRSSRIVENAALKTIAGFMNGEGGTLIIGVSDSGEIKGLENDYGALKKKDRDGLTQAIMTAVSRRMGTDTCQYLEILFHTIDGKEVCRIIIHPSHRPVYIKEGNDTRFYLRTGVSTRWLNVQEAVEFISDKWGK